MITNHEIDSKLAQSGSLMSRRRFGQLVGAAASGLLLPGCSEVQPSLSPYEQKVHAERDRQTPMRKVALEIASYLTPQDAEDGRPASAVYTKVDNELYAALDFDSDFRKPNRVDNDGPGAFVRFYALKEEGKASNVSFGAVRQRNGYVMRAIVHATAPYEFKQEVFAAVAAEGLPNLGLFHEVLTYEDLQFDLVLVRGHASNLAFEIGSENGPTAKDKTPDELEALANEYLKFIAFSDQ